LYEVDGGIVTNNDPTLLTCPTCNAPLDYDGVHSVIRCKFCGNSSVVPASMVADTSASADAWDEIHQLVNNGDLDTAINRFKTYFGSDANESRDAIDAIAGGRFVTPSTPGSHTVAELTEAMEQVQQLVSNGQREKAIDLLKFTTLKMPSMRSPLGTKGRYHRSPCKHQLSPLLPKKRIRLASLLLS
jgi:hypothetical protein